MGSASFTAISSTDSSLSLWSGTPCPQDGTQNCLLNTWELSNIYTVPGGKCLHPLASNRTFEWYFVGTCEKIQLLNAKCHDNWRCQACREKLVCIQQSWSMSEPGSACKRLYCYLDSSPTPCILVVNFHCSSHKNCER